MEIRSVFSPRRPWPLSLPPLARSSVQPVLQPPCLWRIRDPESRKGKTHQSLNPPGQSIFNSRALTLQRAPCGSAKKEHIATGLFCTGSSSSSSRIWLSSGQQRPPFVTTSTPLYGGLLTRWRLAPLKEEAPTVHDRDGRKALHEHFIFTNLPWISILATANLDCNEPICQSLTRDLSHGGILPSSSR